MARVKRAVNAHKKRREVLEKASGYRGQRSRLYRKAKEQLLHSATYEYRDRKKRKGDFRQLWITRINAAARLNDMTYSRLMQGLKAAGVEVDRKVLAELAVNDAPAFAALVEVARAALPTDGTGGPAAARALPERSPISIRSTRNPSVQAVRRLTRRSARVAERRFVVEGPQAVREALPDAARAVRRPGRRGALRRAARRRALPGHAGQPRGAGGDGRDGHARRGSWGSRRCSTSRSRPPWPGARGWSPCSRPPRTRATPAPSSARPTLPAPTRSC